VLLRAGGHPRPHLLEVSRPAAPPSLPAGSEEYSVSTARSNRFRGSLSRPGQPSHRRARPCVGAASQAERQDHIIAGNFRANQNLARQPVARPGDGWGSARHVFAGTKHPMPTPTGRLRRAGEPRRPLSTLSKDRIAGPCRKIACLRCIILVFAKHGEKGDAIAYLSAKGSRPQGN